MNYGYIAAALAGLYLLTRKQPPAAPGGIVNRSAGIPASSFDSTPVPGNFIDISPTQYSQPDAGKQTSSPITNLGQVAQAASQLAKIVAPAGAAIAAEGAAAGLAVPAAGTPLAEALAAASTATPGTLPAATTAGLIAADAPAAAVIPQSAGAAAAGGLGLAGGALGLGALAVLGAAVVNIATFDPEGDAKRAQDEQAARWRALGASEEQIKAHMNAGAAAIDLTPQLI